MLEPLSEEQAYRTLDGFFLGKTSPDAFQLFLTELSNRPETVDEVVGFARCMRDHMIRISLPKPLLDVCGTGGSGQERFNISTASALWLGQMGIPVAKHGNYGSKKPNGSFNFLEALGIPFAADANGVVSQFNAQGYCFIFARYFHPAMKALGPIRQAIGKRTIFNLLGPLCNPAGVTHHVLGVTSVQSAETLAHALQRLGSTKALVVLGADGRDELSLMGTSTLWTVTPSALVKTTCNPESFHNLVETDYPVGDSLQNAEVYKTLMTSSAEEKAKSPLFHHIALNVGAGLYCLEKAETIKEGYITALKHYGL